MIQWRLSPSRHVVLNESVKLSVDDRWPDDGGLGELFADGDLSKSLRSKELALSNKMSLWWIDGGSEGGEVHELLDSHLLADLGEAAGSGVVNIVVVVVSEKKVTETFKK